MRKTKIKIILVILLLGTIAGSTLFALTLIKKEQQTNIAKSLQTVVETTQETLELWIKLRKIELKKLAREKALLNYTTALINKHESKQNIEHSKTLKNLRRYMKNYLDRHSDNGFFIINQNRISVASMRDENLNSLNLIHQQRKNYLDRAFAGETLFIPTLKSDVPLKTSTGHYAENLPTIFIATPVKDETDSVIAVLTIRLDPSKDFTRIIQLGRIGDTGETYAFDNNGTLISESRFDYQLQNTGLITKVDKGILTIRITDPGVNTLKGLKPTLPASERPLTLMAQSAIAKISSHNIEGYRDYRGVPVFGAWVWNDELGIGITTEINVDEAMNPFKHTSFTIIALLLLSTLLTLGLIYYFLRTKH